MPTGISNQFKKPRNSSIELLRIIAMVMIIFHHFAGHGGFDWEGVPATIPHLWYNFIIMGGNIGVDIFILISGYFLCMSDGQIFNFKRILIFWGQVFFYSVVLFLIFKITGCTDLDLGFQATIKSIFPITFSEYWFASVYLVLYIIHPFLNKLLRTLDKKLYQAFVVLVVICWSVIPTFTTFEFTGSSLVWFVSLYIIASYIRTYGLNPKFKCKHYFIMWVAFSSLTYLSSVVLTFLGTKWSVFADQTTYFYGQNKVTTLLISLFLFMTFLNIKMDYHKWINIVASATMGVYLIHDNYYAAPFLWKTIFRSASYQDSLKLIPYSIIAVTIVYICCTLIDLCRKRFIERPFIALVDRYSNDFLKPFEAIVNFFKCIIFGKND